MQACRANLPAPAGSSAPAEAATPPRLAATSLLALLLCGSGAEALASEFGSPPSGEVPILYNDHTVYAKPDLLKEGRVLAALVKDGRIYVPLRSMFEQIGAAVSVSADGKTVTAVKGENSVSVTLGKDETVINGEVRPLDVPPILYKGVVLVPVRVLSEALGAYVQWVPDRRVVVVRYNPPAPPPEIPAPPTAPPAAAPSPAPSAVPTPEPTAAPAQRSYNGFVEGALSAPQTFNEFSNGHWCRGSYAISGAFWLKNSPFALKADFRQDAYTTSDNLIDLIGNHYTRFATIDGGYAAAPVFRAYQSTLDGRVEYKIARPGIAVGVGYLRATTNYGYPNLDAIGVGIEKLPDMRPGIEPFGSAFIYPNASGDYTVVAAASPNFGNSYRQEYEIEKYDLGLAWVLANSPVYLYAGFNGDRYSLRQNAPISQTHDGPYIGLGVKL
jgi:Copper amine oxidase N-terminal domain